MALLRLVEKDGRRVEVPETRRDGTPHPDYKLPAVGWRIRVFIGRDHKTGKRKYVTRTFDRKKDAEKEATRLKRQKDTGTVTAPTRRPLADYLDHWLDNVKAGRIRDRTLADYRGLIRRYVQEPPDGAPLIGSIRMDRLAPAAFEQLYAFLWKEQGLSPRTLQYLHSVVRQALSHAVKTGSLARNPTDAVKPYRQAEGGGTPEKKMRAMTKEEASRFLEAAKDDRLSALWTVLLMGGIRPGEAFGLRWQDVDLDAGKLHIRHSLTRKGVPKVCECGHLRDLHDSDGYGACTEEEYDGCESYQSGTGEGWRLVEPKTDRARRLVVLPEVATAALRAHRARQAEERLQLGAEWADLGFVFTSTLGTPLDRPNLYGRYNGLLEEAGLGAWEGEGEHRTFKPGFRLYDLRHTCATLLLLAGENPKVVSERPGHASVTLTLDTYSHVLPAMQEESARKLEAMFGAGG